LYTPEVRNERFKPASVTFEFKTTLPLISNIFMLALALFTFLKYTISLAGLGYSII